MEVSKNCGKSLKGKCHEIQLADQLGEQECEILHGNNVVIYKVPQSKTTDWKARFKEEIAEKLDKRVN